MKTDQKTKCCARCGKRLKPEVWVYSRFTGLRYCISFNACTRRAKRRPK